MKKVGVAILGLGVVGGGTYKILTENREYFQKTQGVDVVVESVLEKNPERIKALGVESILADSIEEVVSNPAVDIVVEVIGGVGIAKDFVMTALKSGKIVVTSNKEMIAKYWSELEVEAKKMNTGLYFEASCVGGVPIIRTLCDGMQANKLQSIKGIINGTTNYILTKMSLEGLSYEDALSEAQKLGYAELNPTADVEGFDASYKLSILSSIAFNTKVKVEDVHREGITGITKEDIAYGKDLGYVVKLLAVGKNTDKGIEVRVHPAFIEKSNPLASVNDSFNAVSLVGDSVGDIMLYGRGAGSLPTGSAIVSDVLFAARYPVFYYAPFENSDEGNKQTKFVKDFSSQYFIRLTVKDEAGVLSELSGIFAKYKVSIKEVKQISKTDKKATIVIVTHKCYESYERKAMDKIQNLPSVISVDSVIRIED